MKKLKLCIFALVLIFVASCEKEETINNPEDSITTDANFQSKKVCKSHEKLQEKIAKDPELAVKMAEIEAFTRTFPEDAFKAPGDVVTIPVVVHVVYNTNRQNISNSQIRSQIDVLNRDFNKRNSDLNKVPGAFKGRVANVEIKFTLARVTRTKTNIKAFIDDPRNDVYEEDIKFSRYGGKNGWNPRKYLNMWVGNVPDLLGFATFPAQLNRYPEYDGVVINYEAFGTRGTARGPYNLGRTGTHEVGHWLNLRHIWGDGGCNKDDGVRDTPKSDRPNFGCPRYPTKHCSSTDMTMNYMDYTDDACMYMFTNGQKGRMKALFRSGGPRASFR